MVIYRELPREGFDTLQMLDLLGISRTKLERALRNARMSPRIPYMVTNFISSEVKRASTKTTSRGSTPSTAPSAAIRARSAATCWAT